MGHPEAFPTTKRDRDSLKPALAGEGRLAVPSMMRHIARPTFRYGKCSATSASSTNSESDRSTHTSVRSARSLRERAWQDTALGRGQDLATDAATAAPAPGQPNRHHHAAAPPRRHRSVHKNMAHRGGVGALRCADPGNAQDTEQFVPAFHLRLLPNEKNRLPRLLLPVSPYDCSMPSWCLSQDSQPSIRGG
jgi:hypothetical protein